MKKMYKVIKNKKSYSSKAFVLPNLLPKRKISLLTKIRFALKMWYEKWKYHIASLVLGAIIGIMIGLFLADNPYRTSPEVVGLKNVGKVQQVEATQDKYQLRGYAYCYDVEVCIRDIGEELEFSNKDILIAINISRAESGFRSDALGVNTNKSVDRGAMQINSIHKRLSNADAFDYEKNIRFAYQLRKEQGNWNAWSTCHNGKVNCN
jgi:hypothetical protein